MPPPPPPPYRGQVFRVAVACPLRRLFDYLPPPGAEPPPGTRVRVPFGPRAVTGVLVETGEGSELPEERLRPVRAVIDSRPLFPPALLGALLRAARYWQHPVGEVFAAAMPAKIRAGESAKETETRWEPAGGGEVPERAFRRRALLDFIVERGGVSARDIDEAGFSRALLGKLAAGGLVREREVGPAPGFPFDAGAARDPGFRLNRGQREAAAAIDEADGGFRCFLLDGVTGSGKTEVYMRAMRRQLAAGRQCLVLVPEVGLTPQTVARIRRRFDCPVALLHSGLADGARLQAWRRARAGGVGIVIGTRSAVFTPLARPGLIIVDEEHDLSFKQHDGFRYSARDFAIMRAQREGVPVVLGSATPSLESLRNALDGRHVHLELKQRAGGAGRPSMSVIDTSSVRLEAGFSEPLLHRTRRHLDGGGQVLVFVNRRGYAPTLHCPDCGWLAECGDCAARLTVHARPPGLRCHHCGASRPLPVRCGECGGEPLSTSGQGTQKIERFLAARFTDAPVLRVDRDSVRSRRSFDELLAQVDRREPCILLGTQMLAKGHHFPAVTLVAVVDADVGLFSADFRGQEHMAQTIVQVAGRAGRAERPGEVVVQSRHGAHPALKALTELPYQDFARELLDKRRRAGMPPFGFLALLHVDAPSPGDAADFAGRAARTARDAAAGRIHCIGPVPAPMEKRAGRHRIQVHLLGSSRAALQTVLTPLCRAVAALSAPRSVRWSIDVDPLDMI